jgi:membrane protein DedA with SNARE-associated domain
VSNRNKLKYVHAGQYPQAIPLLSQQRIEALRRKAPQLIIIAIALIAAAYFVFSILEDVVIEGGPITSSPIIGAIIALTNGVTSTVQTWGYYGIFGLMFLESCSLPIPSEVILPFAGFLISMGQLNAWIAITLATIAGLLGSLIDYYIGLKGVQTLTEHKILGKILLSTNQLEIAEKWFLKNGSLMVFISRLIPGFRTTFSFPAGAARMPLKRFIIFTTAGCLLWNTILIYLGYYLGKNWTAVAGISHYLIIAAVSAIVVVVIVYFIIRRQKRKNQTASNNKVT